VKILHVVKTSSGARWAVEQCCILVQQGIEVHVAMPDDRGTSVPDWKKAGVELHLLDCNLPVSAPQLLPERIKSIRNLVRNLNPHIIHSHFVSTTIMLRLALGSGHPIPRVFQVPGPLHLEHALYRIAELKTAGKADYWIASSRYTRNLYLKGGVPPDRLYLSYYGTDTKLLLGNDTLGSDNMLLDEGSTAGSSRVVGNVSYMYPPKYFLGQTVGLKGHENLIDALGIVCSADPTIIGIVAGGQWGNGHTYERRLRRRGRRVAGNKIRFTGRLVYSQVRALWNNVDCAVHVPFSENCGGVVEPLLRSVPTIASNVGGLPELVIDGITGRLVTSRDPEILAETILSVLYNLEEAKQQATIGSILVSKMFDVNRTGMEVAAIYDHILGTGRQSPVSFDSEKFIRSLGYDMTGGKN